jgi:predicted CoA-binding protein
MAEMLQKLQDTLKFDRTVAWMQAKINEPAAENATGSYYFD